MCDFRQHPGVPQSEASPLVFLVCVVLPSHLFLSPRRLVGSLTTSTTGYKDVVVGSQVAERLGNRANQKVAGLIPGREK